MPKIVHVAYNNNGEIIAAVEAAAEAGPRPAEGPEVSVGQFEVPSHLADSNMDDYIPRLRVDVAASRLTER
jgi:hypothetical protein